MRVFVTGATGFIGSAVVRELLSVGHQVVGLARSDDSAAALIAMGAEVHRGALNDMDSLCSGAASTDGVIHTAFIHDFQDFAAAVEVDLRAVEALGTALAGSGCPFLVTSGTTMLTPGRFSTEDDAAGPTFVRSRAEEMTLFCATQGVRASVVRLPPSVHGPDDKLGFIPRLIATARDKGVSAYVGNGTNRWAAVHRLDAARLFRLALETAPPGSRLHGIGDEGVLFRDIAQVIGKHLEVPVASIAADQAIEHFGFLGSLVAGDTPASSRLTRKLLDWEPVHPGLIADLDQGSHYFAR